MGPLAVLGLRRGELLRLALVLLALEALALLDGDDVLPVHVVLDVADVRKLLEEALAAEGRALVLRSDGLVVFRAVEDVVQVHLVELLALLAVILVEAAAGERGAQEGRVSMRCAAGLATPCHARRGHGHDGGR